LLKKNACGLCKKICGNVILDENILIRERQYKKCNLTHPSSNFSILFRRITASLLKLIPKYILHYGIKRHLCSTITHYHYADVCSMLCLQHKGEHSYFIELCVNQILYAYLKNINKKLLGKDLRNTEEDPVVNLAFNKYLKRRKK
jgi:hypothetical protein